MTGLITLQFSGLPYTCYPGDPNIFAQDILNHTAVAFNQVGNIYYNYGENIPGVNARIYPWIRINSGEQDGLWYWNTSLSAWVRPHPVPASSDVRLIWVGTLSDLDTFDGGDSGTPGIASGPMWEVDTDFSAKFPVGVGTFTNAGAINVGESTTDTGVTGEDEHTLTEDEMPEHTHGYFDPRIGSGEGIQGDSDSKMVMHKHPTNEDCSGTSCAAGSDEPHNNLPPMIGVYFIKRTARVYYKAT